MGYTHYWEREMEIEGEVFRNIVMDFQRVLPILRSMGVELSRGDGFGYPDISFECVSFNGSMHCGHTRREDLKNPWPVAGARGVFDIRDGRLGVTGTWSGGTTIDTRLCNGECAYEQFIFPRVLSPKSYQEPTRGKYRGFCKTGFYPYDLAVTAFLVIAKHHLKEKISVTSDGEICHLKEAMFLCQLIHGYGNDFVLDK
jgi:hypothetical protein